MQSRVYVQSEYFPDIRLVEIDDDASIEDLKGALTALLPVDTDADGRADVRRPSRDRRRTGMCAAEPQEWFLSVSREGCRTAARTSAAKTPKADASGGASGKSPSSMGTPRETRRATSSLTSRRASVAPASKNAAGSRRRSALKSPGATAASRPKRPMRRRRSRETYAQVPSAAATSRARART